MSSEKIVTCCSRYSVDIEVENHRILIEVATSEKADELAEIIAGYVDCIEVIEEYNGRDPISSDGTEKRR